MKKVITILMTICLIGICGCGSSAPAASSKEKSTAASTEIATVPDPNDPISKEWEDDKYGYFSATYLYENNDIDSAMLAYKAPSDNTDCLAYLCTAMNTFIELGKDTTYSKTYMASLPGDDKAMLLYTDTAGITGREIDGEVALEAPSWINTYNTVDTDLMKWLLDCYGKVVDEMEAKMGENQ